MLDEVLRRLPLKDFEKELHFVSEAGRHFVSRESAAHMLVTFPVREQVPVNKHVFLDHHGKNEADEVFGFANLAKERHRTE